jgi:Fe-S oxidoreductase
MFFPVELWREICGFLIHNIKKHGKHLQINNKNVVNFNQVIQELPPKTVPHNGPRIIFGSNKHCYRLIKFLYNIQIPSWNHYKLIIEYIPYIDEFDNDTYPKIPSIHAYYHLLT